jgi:uncharacterized membrane protein YeiH
MSCAGTLYAVPALLGAAVVVVAADRAGNLSAVFPVLGAIVCIMTRLIGVRYGLGLPQRPERTHEAARSRLRSCAPASARQ